MGGASVSMGSPTLADLAQKIEKAVADAEKVNMSLDDSIQVTNRRNLERRFEDMEKEPKEKRGTSFDRIKKLLEDRSDEWFAFCHFGS
jgi:hypothetical protein